MRLGSTSHSYTTLTSSNIPQGQSPPNSNSRGDYVTTRYTTQHPTYTLPLGFTNTEDFGPSGVVLVGPTTWATQDVLPVVEVANDLTTTSSTPQPWDANGFLDKNETVVASFISYGRQPACTSDFFSYAAESVDYCDSQMGYVFYLDQWPDYSGCVLLNRTLAYDLRAALLRKMFDILQ